jgi:hypothetical protein
MQFTHLLCTAFQNFLIELVVCTAQVWPQALRGLVGELDAVLQQANGQAVLQGWGRLSRQEQPAEAAAAAGGSTAMSAYARE